MIKAMIFLKRREDMSREAFRNWWLGAHKDKAAQLPNLRRLCFNLAVGEGPYDGVAEQWYDTLEDMEAAYQSDIGKVVAEDSLKHVSGRERLLVEENEIQV
jgi:uncharacterized protein (TIGR02118 family)